MPLIILLYFLQAQHVFGHYYVHHQELENYNVDYHIGRFVL